MRIRLKWKCSFVFCLFCMLCHLYYLSLWARDCSLRLLTLNAIISNGKWNGLIEDYLGYAISSDFCFVFLLCGIFNLPIYLKYTAESVWMDVNGCNLKVTIIHSLDIIQCNDRLLFRFVCVCVFWCIHW